MRRPEISIGSAALRWRIVASFVVLGFLAGSAHAATIVLYNAQNPDNSNQSGDPPWSANAVGAGVTASDLERNWDGITANGKINSSGVDTNATNHPSSPYYRSTTYTDVDNMAVDDGAGSPQQAAAVANGAYFYFTVSAANPLEKLALSSITYNIAQGTGSTGQERGYALYSSLDNYASALAADAMIDALRPNWVDGNIPLPGAPVSSATFRLYLFVGDGAGIGSNIDFDNIQVNGEVVPVPEPAGVALLSLGWLGLSGVLRRR